MSNIQINHNTDAHQFETTIDGITAFITYVDKGDSIVYEHTIVPPELGGQGVGSALVQHALNYAREQDKKVIPQCSFVAAYIGKHPEYKDLVGN